MDIHGKFYKLNGGYDLDIYCENVTMSLRTIKSRVVERLAVLYSYKFSNDFDDGNFSYTARKIRELKEMDDERIMEEAFNTNVVGVNLVLQTIPSVILENVDELIVSDVSDKLTDVTSFVIDKIYDGIDVEEIKKFVTTHSDDEIVDKYCTDKRYSDCFWDL